MFRRVADTIAQIDRNYDPKADAEASARKFYQMMSSLAFMLNSPTLMNAAGSWGSSPPASCCRWRTTSTPSSTRSNRPP